MFFSVIISLSAVITGLFVSYYFDLASGGTIVLIALAIFLAGLFFNRKDYNGIY